MYHFRPSNPISAGGRVRLDDQRESDNVEDRRRGGKAGGIGIGAIILALAASYFFGVDPSVVLQTVGSLDGNSPPAATPAPDDQAARFVSKVLASTEDTWREIFRKAGRRYEEPKLVLFSGSTATACGAGEEAMGPFYCPADRSVYIDLSFYRELRERYRAPGEFAQAYVIAHEVGHHVQNLLGVSDKVHAAEQRAGSRAQANALSVRLELQADCLAGVWGNHADRVEQLLEPGEAKQAIVAASAIGDDRLQKAARGYVVPDSFTHGSSEQRVRWFERGMESGDINQCDTFKSAKL